MDIEWYERIANNMEDLLKEECDLLAEMLKDGVLEIMKKSYLKHPEMEIVLIDDDEGGYTSFVKVAFDPYNQEFYSRIENPGIPEMRIIFTDTDQMFEHIHELAHILLGREEDDEQDNEEGEIEFSEEMKGWMQEEPLPKALKNIVQFDNRRK